MASMISYNYLLAYNLNQLWLTFTNFKTNGKKTIKSNNLKILQKSQSHWPKVYWKRSVSLEFKLCDS